MIQRVFDGDQRGVELGSGGVVLRDELREQRAQGFFLVGVSAFGAEGWFTVRLILGCFVGNQCVNGAFNGDGGAILQFNVWVLDGVIGDPFRNPSGRYDSDRFWIVRMIDFDGVSRCEGWVRICGLRLRVGWGGGVRC